MAALGVSWDKTFGPLGEVRGITITSRDGEQLAGEEEQQTSVLDPGAIVLGYRAVFPEI